MLVLLLALLTHARGSGTWHSHVEAPRCWEAPHARKLLCDWRKPEWDEWALYIEQEAWGTAPIRPLSHSLSFILCSAPMFVSFPFQLSLHWLWEYVHSKLFLKSIHVKLHSSSVTAWGAKKLTNRERGVNLEVLKPFRVEMIRWLIT